MDNDLKQLILYAIEDYLDFHMEATEETYMSVSLECDILRKMIHKNKILDSKKNKLSSIIVSYVSHITYQNILYGSEPNIPFLNLFSNIKKSTKMFEYLNNLSGISEKVIEECNSYIKNAKSLKFFYANGKVFDYQSYKIINDFNSGSTVSIPLGKAIQFSFFRNYQKMELEQSIYIRIGQQEPATCLLELQYMDRDEISIFANYEGKKVLLKSLQFNDRFWVCNNLDMVFKNKLLSGSHFSVYIPQNVATSPIIGNIGSSLGVYIQGD